MSDNSNQFQPNPTNGTGYLPPPREAIVEQGLRIQQETAAERDRLHRELAQAHSDIAGYKVAVEALQAQLNDARSRVETAMLTRDEAVARRAEVETVLASMLALGRAFSIKAEPLITGTGDEDVSTMSANDRRIALDMAGAPERYGKGG